MGKNNHYFEFQNEFNKVKFESPRLQMCSYLNQAKYGKGVWKNFNSIPKNSRL